MGVKKILIITPKFPYPSYGACELDRAAGIEIFLRLGYAVTVITKVYDDKYKAEARRKGDQLGCAVIPVSYKYLYAESWGQKISRGLRRLLQPWYLDGAAFEYDEPEIRRVVKETLASFRPDLVWVDYTYLWPLYGLVRSRRIPIVTRSINFEARHFLEEDGRTLVNYLKFLPKLLTEYLVSKKSDVICAITPLEAELYRKMGARRVTVLPLRGLSSCLAPRPSIREHAPLNVFFSGSTYNVAHNRKALEFLLRNIIPLAERKFPNQFKFHIFGGKIPLALNRHFTRQVIRHDYLPRDQFAALMAEMDICVAPSLYGAGMQQKIFEPLARGIPTITSPRGLGGYPFVSGQEVLCATGAPEFVEQLGTLTNSAKRQRVAEAAWEKSIKFFSREIMDQEVMKAVAVADV